MGSSLSRSAVLPYGTQIIERERREREREGEKERERETEREREREREREGEKVREREGGGEGGHVQISSMSCEFVLVFGILFKRRRNFNNDKYRLTL